MWNARWRLASLWIAHVARVMGDNALRIFVVLDFARQSDAHTLGAWHLVTLLLMVPAVLFAPVNGALCNSLPKPRVLVGSAGFALAVVGLFAYWTGPSLLLCWGLVALSSAINGPVRYAFLPAAAQDSHWPLTRINGFFEMGSAAAIVAGLVLGVGEGTTASPQGPSVLVWLVTPLLLLSLLASAPVWFASDVRRPESAGQAVAGFFRDLGRIWRVKETRGCLFGLASLRGLLTGMMGALVAGSLNGASASPMQLIEIGGWIMGGVAAGSFLAGLQRHPRRILGLVPWGATGLTLGVIIAALGHVPGKFLCVLLGIMAGLVNVPLAATYQADLPADARGNGMAVRNFTDYLLTALVAGPLFALGRWGGWPASAQLWLLAALASLLAVPSWYFLRREVFEQMLEFVVWPIYQIRGYGPGIDAMPLQGPVLVVANHSAWMDPVWVGKVLPRGLIGMLTSVFFDIPALRWLMTRILPTIRVKVGGFRREVPELKEAVAVLDRGDCVLIFPEGGLRRKDEQFLRPFGQGVWRLLRERPQVPVVVCWIEGGWGCYFSYKNGLPTKNKRFDFWRPIDIAVSEPRVLDPALLADQRATRQYLMQLCLETRKYLGLEVPALEGAKGEEGEEESLDDR